MAPASSEKLKIILSLMTFSAVFLDHFAEIATSLFDLFTEAGFTKIKPGQSLITLHWT